MKISKRFREFWPLLLMLTATPWGRAQTQINLAAQGKNADFSRFASTKPSSVGSTIPSVCTVGEVFFNTNAPAGENLYGCTSLNTWIQLGGSGGAGMASQLGDFAAVNTSSTVQTLGSNCSNLTPCNIREGAVVYTLTTPVTLSLSGTTASSTVYWYLSSSQILTAGHNSAATLTCSGGCTVAANVSAFPPDSTPLWQTTFTANSWNPISAATMDKRSLLTRNVISPGSGVASVTDPTTGIQTLSTDPTIVPRYSGGSGAPTISCMAGRDFYTDTAAGNLYFCDAANTWKQANGGGSPFFGGSLSAIVPGNWSAFGTGCTRSTVTGASGGSALQVTGSTGTQNVCGYSQPVAAGNFTHTFVLYGAVAGYNNSEVGVGFTDGTKAEYCAVSGSASLTSSVNDIAVNTLAAATSLAAASGDAAANYLPGSGPVFFQLSRTGTTLSCAWSPDGQNYLPVFTDTTPFLTASSVAAIVDPRGAARSSTLILASFQ